MKNSTIILLDIAIHHNYSVRCYIVALLDNIFIFLKVHRQYPLTLANLNLLIIAIATLLEQTITSSPYTAHATNHNTLYTSHTSHTKEQ